MARHENFKEKYGPWALVSGAAMGLGAEFTRQLAAKGLNLVLVDIKKELVWDLANQLTQKYGIRTMDLHVDLSEPHFMDRILQVVKDLEIGLLVSNAGISAVGWFLDTPLEAHLRELYINARAPLLLTYEFGRQMLARGHGGIILLASLSASQGTALVANYAATKAYNWVLAESLWDELREKGVDVLAFPPGSTDTPGFREEKPQVTPLVNVMNAEEAVREALAALGKKPVLIPGGQNRFSFFITGRLLSRKAAIRLIGEQMRKMYKK